MNFPIKRDQNAVAPIQNPEHTPLHASPSVALKDGHPCAAARSDSPQHAVALSDTSQYTTALVEGPQHAAALSDMPHQTAALVKYLYTLINMEGAY